jgi:hypothetical protein
LRAAEHRGERGVVAHVEVREQPRDLVGARDAARAMRCAGSEAISRPSNAMLPASAR